MGWPFSTASAPTFDSGAEAVPTSIEDVPNVPSHATPLWLMGCNINNAGAGELDLEVLDGSGERVFKVTVPVGVNIPYEWPFMPITGLQWVASGDGITAKLWGYV